MSRIVIKEGFLGETGQRGSNSHRSLKAQMRNPDPEATGSFICAPSPGQGCLTPPRVDLRAMTPVRGLRGRETWAQGPVHPSSKAMTVPPPRETRPGQCTTEAWLQTASGLVSAVWPGRAPRQTKSMPAWTHSYSGLAAGFKMAERREGRGGPPRMPGDDSSPIPIYFLSLMLLKSPTCSANMEGAQGSGGEGKRGLGAEEGTAEVVLTAG